MFERNDDVLYICYDNEAYMNTGVQVQPTPPMARTATTPTLGSIRGSSIRHRQERSADCHGASDPFVATASIAHLKPTSKANLTGRRLHGARYVHIHSPCPFGWGRNHTRRFWWQALRCNQGCFRCSKPSDGEIADGIAFGPESRLRII